MLFNTMVITILSITIVIVLSPSPLNTGLWIILTTFIISSALAITTPSWFPFLLFLIYVGGLLVMFAYFVSIQPNQQMSTLKILVTIALSQALIIPLTINFTIQPTRHQTYPLSILELLLSQNTQILIFLGLILFLALVVVVKITKIFIGPLRPFSCVPSHSKKSSPY